MAQSNTQLFPIPITAGKQPIDGPKAIQVQYTFGVGVSQEITDMTSIKQQGKISLIQSVFIDNTLNTQSVTLQTTVINQQITIPAGYQGIFPIFATDQAVFIVSSQGSGDVTVAYSNTPQPAALWAGTNQALVISGIVQVTDPVLDATVIGNRVQTLNLNEPATISDGSGVIAVGGVSQVLFPANPARQGWSVMNIDEAALEPMAVSLVGAAALATNGSLTLAPSGGPGYPGGYVQGVGTNQITIVAASGGHRFTAYEW